MSESLMFAILGFLVASLFCTVFASFLWRRAVTVTTRRMAQSDVPVNVVDDAELQSRSAARSARDGEVAQLRAQITSAETERSEAETSLHQTTEELRKELKTAQDDRKETQATLQDTQEQLASGKDRISTLETAIRSLMQISGLSQPLNTEATPATTTPPETTPFEATDEPIEPMVETKTDIAPLTEVPQGDNPTIEVTRSLEERIEALKQGQPAH